jgi:hypothetical protein
LKASSRVSQYNQGFTLRNGINLGKQYFSKEAFEMFVTPNVEHTQFQTLLFW